MVLFLNGGGSAQQITDTYKIFKQCIDTQKPLLYIPLAMTADRYPSCWEWVSKEFSSFEFPQIDMVTSMMEVAEKNLHDYCAVFIGGGNTYKLLKELKESSVFEQLKTYLNNGGVVLGGSAGAIVFGKTIDSCNDEKRVDLKDKTAFNMALGVFLGAHYTNRDKERTERAYANYVARSFDAAVIALPEECTLYIDEKCVCVIGCKPYYLFKNGLVIIQESNVKYTHEEFKALTKL